jgi:hypothetical protein
MHLMVTLEARDVSLVCYQRDGARSRCAWEGRLWHPAEELAAAKEGRLLLPSHPLGVYEFTALVDAVNQ